MTAILGRFRRAPAQKAQETAAREAKEEKVRAKREVRSMSDSIAPNDPLLALLLSAPGVVDLETLKISSPALDELRAQGMRLVAPLVSQGELMGVLSIGPRRSEQDYSSDDRKLLANFAAQAAPALRVAQLARAQEIEAEARGRLEQELKVARVVQETLLPREIPQPAGWAMAAFWKPAREMSGDFYDFIRFEDGRLGIVEADVTGKGMPAALVMATTRSILHTTAERLVTPGAVLERANDMLCPDIPPNMFVTCLYALLDPATGKIQYANAGHNPPYLRTSSGVTELRATGMPLGLMPGMRYEEKQAPLGADDVVVIYSDGLVEAHNAHGEMFGFPRLHSLMAQHADRTDLVEFLSAQLDAHVGPDWEQEDDVTMVSLHRLPQPVSPNEPLVLTHFEVASEPGNEREAMQRVADAVEPLHMPKDRLERLKTAVAEATMNAMEHGNHYQPDHPTGIEVRVAQGDLLVRITDDMGDEVAIPSCTEPDLDAKLAGLQSPRGWGLYLIRNMVDDMRHVNEDGKHTLELVMHLGPQTAEAAEGV
jgi:serine phosphatase RsbU (regulator of sigma subunit)/anti-sigma regulatory factor (Ser/Thr protein kinase)